MEGEVIYETEFYNIEIHKDDPDNRHYWIINREHGIVESKEYLKPQALVYCEQFNILLKNNSHKTIAENMVKGMALDALDGMAFDTPTH